MKWLALLLGLFSAQAFSQETSEARELIGSMGGRATLMQLFSTERPDGSARVTGDYLVLPTMQQRFLEGEVGPMIRSHCANASAKSLAIRRRTFCAWR